MLDVTVPIKQMVRMTALRWYGHILQRKEGNIFKEVKNFEVNGRRKRVNQRLYEKTNG